MRHIYIFVSRYIDTFYVFCLSLGMRNRPAHMTYPLSQGSPAKAMVMRGDNQMLTYRTLKKAQPSHLRLFSENRHLCGSFRQSRFDLSVRGGIENT